MTKRYRDSETGRMVTKEYAESHKKTTQSETVKPSPKGGGSKK